MAEAERESASVIETLQAFGRMRDTDLQEMVDLLASLCGAAYAAIAVTDGGQSHLVLTHGLAPTRCALEPAGWVDEQGRPFGFHASAPIHAPSGGVVGRLCVFDSTPLSLSTLQQRALETMASQVSGVLELRMRRAEDGESAAEDEMARIAAEISHDMRTPLASIVANVELLLDAVQEDADPTVEVMLRRTDRAANRLLRMVEGLMAFHQAGYLRDSTDVDLSAVLEAVVLELQGLLDSADATLRLHQLPTVAGDPDQLYSVLLNLLSNAVKYRHPDEAPVIEVSCRMVGDLVRVSVTDNGIGIDPAQAERMFGMFGRASTRVEGHGIGLATVRRIARAHGGDAGLVSDGERGTEAWFELPVATAVPTQRSLRSARVSARS